MGGGSKTVGRLSFKVGRVVCRSDVDVILKKKNNSVILQHMSCYQIYIWILL